LRTSIHFNRNGHTEIVDEDISVYFCPDGADDPSKWFSVSVTEINGEGDYLDEPTVSISNETADLFYGTFTQFHLWLEKNKEINVD